MSLSLIFQLFLSSSSSLLVIPGYIEIACSRRRYPSLLSSNIGWQKKRKTLLRAPLWAMFHITREQVGYWWLICAQATWESKYSSKVRLCLILIRPSSRPPQQTHHLLPPPKPQKRKRRRERSLPHFYQGLGWMRSRQIGKHPALHLWSEKAVLKSYCLYRQSPNLHSVQELQLEEITPSLSS